VFVEEYAKDHDGKHPDYKVLGCIKKEFPTAEECDTKLAELNS
jgi:hypothetical protein